MRLALVPLGFWGLLIALNAPEFLVQGTFIDVADDVGLGIFWRIVNHGITAGRPAMAQVD